MAHVRPQETVDSALRCSDAGMPDAENAARHGVAIKTIRRWRREYQRRGRPRGQAHLAPPCPRCQDAPLDTRAYAELVGWYLGDGHITRGRRDVFNLHVFNDAAYVGDNAHLLELMTAVKPGGRPHTRLLPGCLVTTMSWKHWPCLFPQHGPGRKHERPIVLEPWQVAIVEAHPAAFLRGLFHSPRLRPSLRGLRSSEEIEEGRHARSAATRVRPVSKSLDRATWQSNHETISNPGRGRPARRADRAEGVNVPVTLTRMDRVRGVGVAALLIAGTLVAGCDASSDGPPTAAADPARCVVSDPEGELILNPGSLAAHDAEMRLEGVELRDAENLEVVETDTVAFSGNPSIRGIILDYPPMKNAGLADSLADWDERRPLVGRTLTPADGLQAVLVVVRLTDPSAPGHLTGVALEATAEGRTYPQPVLVKPHGEPCTVDDIASTRSWLR